MCQHMHIICKLQLRWLASFLHAALEHSDRPPQASSSTFFSLLLSCCHLHTLNNKTKCPAASCEPRTATGRGLVRLEAEAAWAALAAQLQLPLTIFRLGGARGAMCWCMSWCGLVICNLFKRFVGVALRLAAWMFGVVLACHARVATTLLLVLGWCEEHGLP